MLRTPGCRPSVCHHALDIHYLDQSAGRRLRLLQTQRSAALLQPQPTPLSCRYRLTHGSTEHHGFVSLCSFSTEGRQLLFTVLCSLMTFVLMVRRPRHTIWRNPACCFTANCFLQSTSMRHHDQSLSEVRAPCPTCARTPQLSSRITFSLQVISDLADPSEVCTEQQALLLVARLRTIKLSNPHMNKHTLVPMLSPAWATGTNLRRFRLQRRRRRIVSRPAGRLQQRDGDGGAADVHQQDAGAAPAAAHHSGAR